MANPETPTRNTFADRTWLDRGFAGVLGGLAGGVGMGLILQFGTELVPVIGRIAGEATVLRGWLVHVLTSIAFGLLFAAFVSVPIIRELETSVGASVLLGVVHATALSFVTIGVLLPVATVVLGLPDLSLASRVTSGPTFGGLIDAWLFGLAHVVYGVVLGAVYAAAQGLPVE